MLLLEAGPDYAGVAQLPPDVADASAPTTGHDWGYVSEPDDLGRVIELPRGRLMGGCSATNGAFLMRGWPHDFDGWAAAGNPGWSFDELLPVLPRHGERRRLRRRVARARRGRCRCTARRATSSARCSARSSTPRVAAGHPLVPDHNRPGAIGVGSLPRNVSDGLRMSAALTHLAPARERPNLTVRSGAMVDRVELSGGRAVGVRLADGEVVACDRVRARRRVPTAARPSCCGPAIGPAAELASTASTSAPTCPASGQGLADHPLVAVDLPTSPGYTGPRFQTMLTMRSSYADPEGPPDLHLFAAGPFDDPGAPSGGVFGVVTGLLSPTSRGTRAAAVGQAGRPAAHRRRAPAHPGRPAPDGGGTRHARALSRTRAAGGALSRAPSCRRARRSPTMTSRASAASIRARVGSYHHPVGTCAMGAAP